MRVILSPRAEKQLRKISKIEQVSVARKIRLLKKKSAQDEKLQGFKNIYRTRVGPFRIVYRKDTRGLYIVLIAHRREVYRLLKRLF